MTPPRIDIDHTPDDEARYDADRRRRRGTCWECGGTWYGRAGTCSTEGCPNAPDHCDETCEDWEAGRC